MSGFYNNLEAADQIEEQQTEVDQFAEDKSRRSSSQTTKLIEYLRSKQSDNSLLMSDITSGAGFRDISSWCYPPVAISPLLQRKD